ncbi:hypothetical protein [Viridibacillus arvi]|uniref:hypothetical protein n=1 Tax=Viridibacillus arvi TaxID=263475 RepID=UPI0034CDDCCC
MAEVIDIVRTPELGYNTKKESGNMLREEMLRFDDAFPDGVFVIPRPGKEPKVKVRALADYCDSIGVSPSDLTPAEMERFLVRDTE